MSKKNLKKVYCCSKCSYQSSKWIGRCPECKQWDTFHENIENVKSSFGILGLKLDNNVTPSPINSIQFKKTQRIYTRIKEFDRVLGGGLVLGSLVLIGGDPGIGKSTLMLQCLNSIANNGYKVLYVSGEESLQQIYIRSSRLKSTSPNLMVISEISIDNIIKLVIKENLNILVIDSIQTMITDGVTSIPGSITQVRESTMKLMILAKQRDVSIFLIGHVTKEGSIAGPKLLEHMVDTVLYFEGDQNHVFRILRAVKNRFGSTNEIGIFEMKEVGLVEVKNPSAIFLSERPINLPGSIVTSSIEGTRPILVELQALVGKTNFGTPRRTILGLEQNRVALLLAVMEKKLKVQLTGYDVFMNVVGGIKITEPSVDLAIISVIISCLSDKPIKKDTIVMGEVGLAGEIRAISKIDTRIAEAKKLGFKHCIIPLGNMKQLQIQNNIEISPVDNIEISMKLLF